MAANRERRSNAGNRLNALLNQEMEMEELFDDEGVDEEFDIAGKDEEDIVDSDFDQSSADESLDEDEEEANVNEDPEEAKKRKKKQAMLNHLKTGKSSMSLPDLAKGLPPSTAAAPSKSSKTKVAAQPPWMKRQKTAATTTATTPPSPGGGRGSTTPSRRRALQEAPGAGTATAAAAAAAATLHPKIPAEIRKSSRRTTVQNKKETEQKLQEYEARRAAQPKREKVVVHKMTQEELLAEAAKTEQLNLASLQAFKALELENKKRTVKKKTGIVGPCIRYHSFTEWVHHGPLIQVLADMAPSPQSANAAAAAAASPTTTTTTTAAVTAGTTRTSSRVSSRAGSVGPDGQETTTGGSSSGGGVPPQRLAQTLAQTLLAQQRQDGKSSRPGGGGGGGRSSSSNMASRESSPTRSGGTRTPGTPMSVDDPQELLLSSSLSLHKQPPLSTQQQQQQETPSIPGPAPTAPTPALFHTMTLSANSIARKRKRLPASQLCGRNWVSFVGFDSDEDLPTNEWSYAENYPEKHSLCPITGLPAKYRDPTSGIPYANKEAYKVLQNVMRHGYVWSNGLNAYCHDVGQVLPRNTPAGMADALSGGHHPSATHAIVFSKDGELISGGLPGGGGGGYIYRRRTTGVQPSSVVP
ncbi:Vacuolar protein sorting-associated protein 72 [Actinomortierella ambigua]|uniref:Vacuolar protein sorting-associated protein 72 n=1 Tax=Actinomortierella ambigua TaxID=1343610 RepID=A0A9P6PQF1_9FUNG|nr:Vacuolar protein sorting-associated protein 72 [Actinomortierella ambigua]